MNTLAFENTAGRPFRNRQGGFLTLGQTLAVLAVGGIVFLYNIPRIQGMFSTTKVEQAYGEIHDLIIATQKYGTIIGSYDSALDVEELVDKHFGLSGYTDGDDENAYKLDITVAQRSGGGATITYQFDNEPACEQLDARVDNISAVMKTPAPACSGSNPYTLTFHIN